MGTSYNRILSLFLLCTLAGFLRPVIAQTNLLQNPGFDNAGAYGRTASSNRFDFTFAPGWEGWQTNSPSTQSWMNIDAIAFPHTANFKLGGDASQNIGRGSATFTAAAYQVVPNIPAGTTLRATVSVYQDNIAASGARTRIGIGSNVGGNPFGSPITWSNFMTAVDAWTEISVEATVPEGNVTVFIYSTQSQPNDPNQVYYDNASLIVVGEGEVTVGDDGSVTVPTATPQQFAPFVAPQGADESGRVVHTVQVGDTLAAIAVAYGVSVSEIRELNNLGDSSFLQIGQQLVIREGGGAVAAPTTQPPTGNAGGGFATATPGSVVAATATTVPDTSGLSPIQQTIQAQSQQQVAQASTATPTPIPPTATLIPTQTAPPTQLPLNTTVPTQPVGTPVDPATAPTAPVDQGTNVDPLRMDGRICVLVYDDLNQNNIREAGEGLLPNAPVRLEGNGYSQAYTTDGVLDPICYTELTPGLYTLTSEGPPGYGIVRSSRLVVNVQLGSDFLIQFGAAQGVEVAQVPTPIVPANSLDSTGPLIEEDADSLASLRGFAGIVVLGMAGATLMGGVGIIAVLASRN